MNKRTKSLIYAIFSVIVIVALAITLIFVPKDKEDLDNNETEIVNQEVYAESFTLNLPATIKILKGTYVTLSSGYYSVVPSELSNKLLTEVEVKNGGVNDGIVFEENKITANNVGSYSIKFKMQKSKSGYFTKSVNIVVFENVQESHVYSNDVQLRVDESKNISDLFTITNEEDCNITTGQNVVLNDNVLTAKNVGDCDVYFKFTQDYLTYNYKFTLGVLPKPVYSIELVDIANNTINLNVGSSSHIQFEVKDIFNESVSQLVKAWSSDEDIVIIEQPYDDALIKIRALKSGNAQVILFLKEDESIKTVVNVYVN